MADWLDVSDQTPRRAYTAVAAQTVFTFPFVFFDEGDLVVTVNGVTKTLSTDYVTSGALEDVGGAVTFIVPMVGGETVVIVRDLPIELTTHIPPSGPLNIPATNLQFSKLVAMIQEVATRAVRALLQPDSDAATIGLLPDKATRASKFLAFDANGDPISTAGVGVGTVVSAFMATVLDDTTAIAARATLGITDQSAYTGIFNHLNFR